MSETPRRAEGPVKKTYPKLLWLGTITIMVAIVLLLGYCESKENTTEPGVFQRPAISTPAPEPSGTEIPSPTASITGKAPRAGLPIPIYPAEFGDGFWLVDPSQSGPGVIAPVFYRADNPTDKCFWARVSVVQFPHPKVIQTGHGKKNREKGVWIQPTDKAFYSRDCGTWEHHD